MIITCNENLESLNINGITDWFPGTLYSVNIHFRLFTQETERHFYKMAEMASGWHIASFLQAITACCSNFVAKIGRAKVTMMVVSLLTLTEIVFETKTLVDAIKRKNMLADNDSLTDLDDQQCSFGGYDDSLRGYVILYALSNVAEILYFTVWFYVFYHKHYTPIYMHLLQILIAISLEMPLMCTAWCMLQGLPGKVNYDDVFWDMILLATFLCNAWLSMCFKLWDILSDLSTIQDRGFSPVVLWFFKLMGIIIMSSFHTIFVFTPIVYILLETFEGSLKTTTRKILWRY